MSDNQLRNRIGPSERKSSRLRLSQVSRPVTMKEQVYLTLRERLTHGKPGPNERIVEKDVTDQLGVSRTPVREALSRLASEGFLVATRHGYKVPDFTIQDVLNLFEVRLLLEPIAARQAAENPMQAGIQEMRRAIVDEKAAHEKGVVTRFLKAHAAFRDAWLKRARNPLLLQALGRTLHSFQFIRRRTMSDPVMREFMINSHQSLLSAMEAADADWAERVQTDTIHRFKALVLTRVFDEEAAHSIDTTDVARSRSDCISPAIK